MIRDWKSPLFCDKISLNVNRNENLNNWEEKMNILLVEDNQLLAKGLIYSLAQNNDQVLYAINVKETLSILKNNKIDIALLDVSLPDGNGFDLYKNYLNKKNIATIFLTAKDEEDDIVKGLELGAEDYITKPFGVKELLARIHKIQWRKKQNTVISIKEIDFDLDKMEVYKNKEKIELTSLELKILHLLFLNRNKVVTRNDIIDKIWEWTGNDINDNTVTVYLKRIREKLDTNIILTIKGIGYRIDTIENKNTTD